ncbi:hypothetical protein CBL_00468 [Carabus blaptoides fortunei]
MNENMFQAKTKKSPTDPFYLARYYKVCEKNTIFISDQAYLQRQGEKNWTKGVLEHCVLAPNNTDSVSRITASKLSRSSPEKSAPSTIYYATVKVAVDIGRKVRVECKYAGVEY